MKRLILTLLLCSFFLNGFCTTWNISNVDNSFTPDSLTIDEGDELSFNIQSIHNAVEVSQTVWNTNGNSPVIGFTVPYGGGIVSASQLTIGTHFYVCTPHAFMGMKGKIIVQAISGIDVTKNEKDMQVYPNPVEDKFSIQFYLTESKMLVIELVDIQGKLAKVLVPKTRVSGTFLRSFDLEKGMASGIYLIRMTLDNSPFFKKVVVL